jgi:hypothetical protein
MWGFISDPALAWLLKNEVRLFFTKNLSCLVEI